MVGRSCRLRPVVALSYDPLGSQRFSLTNELLGTHVSHLKAIRSDDRQGAEKHPHGKSPQPR